MLRRKKSLRDAEIDWARSIPFLLVHALACAGIVMGVWQIAIGQSIVLPIVIGIVRYYVGMFLVTGVRHRYFSHRTYKMNRVVQFIATALALTDAQKGAKWWSEAHKAHHRYSDTPQDLHSPLDGFWWSHVLWILSKRYTNLEALAREGVSHIDVAKIEPEILWLEKWYWVPPAVLGTLIFWFWGWTALFIGFFLSTVFLWHGTFFVNSLAHVWGTQRFQTGDTSRNNFLIALITCGEGWHNNHHKYQWSASQGLFWWEIDLTYYGLTLLSIIGLIRDVREKPSRGRISEDIQKGLAE